MVWAATTERRFAMPGKKAVEKTGGNANEKNADVFLKAVGLMNMITNSAAFGNAYDRHLGKKGRCDEIDRCFGTACEAARMPGGNSGKFWNDVFSLPVPEKQVLGFKCADQADGKMNIPLWVWQMLPGDMEFDGRKKSDIEPETRYGCVVEVRA